MKEIHEQNTHFCQCMKCVKMRLVYALLVASNHHDITAKDLEIGLLIITTMLSKENV
jgi:hypothetical protein